MALFGDDARAPDLAQPLIGNAHNDGLANVRHTNDEVLDLPRCDVQPPRMMISFLRPTIVK